MRPDPQHDAPRASAAPWSRRRFLKALGSAALLAPLGQRAFAAAPHWPASSVLIIGDSMAMCGFGQRLHKNFRNSGAVAVNTYMACGTQPLSWTTLPGYAGAQSRCGYWTIESSGAGAPVEFADYYGMKPGHRPQRYDVPKIENLLPALRPDLLVVQLGNNLYPVLKGNARATAVDSFIAPFLAQVAASAPAVPAVYWIAPPASGADSPQAQDMLVERLQACGGPGVRVVDTRSLLNFPYRKLAPDKQHFFGPDMDVWADKVFGIIESDMSAGGRARDASLLASGAGAPVVAPPAPPPVLVVQCALERMCVPYRREQIAPYNESLVAFVYRVQRVLKGEFSGSRLVVLRAAHIDGKRQPMHEFSTGQQRILRLLPVDLTPWATLKAKDDPRFLELERFVCAEDHEKLGRHL